MDNSSCVAHCPANYYENEKRFICEKCADPHCTLCAPTDDCEKCDSSYYLIRNLSETFFCIKTCINGTFPLNNKCEHCPPSCMICNSTTHCSKCDLGKKILQNSSGEICLSNCPENQPFTFHVNVSDHPFYTQSLCLHLCINHTLASVPSLICTEINQNYNIVAFICLPIIYLALCIAFYKVPVKHLFHLIAPSLLFLLGFLANILYILFTYFFHK